LEWKSIVLPSEVSLKQNLDLLVLLGCFCLHVVFLLKQKQAFAWFCLSKTKAELSMQKQQQA
jgi:hypothetical protein